MDNPNQPSFKDPNQLGFKDPKFAESVNSILDYRNSIIYQAAVAKANRREQIARAREEALGALQEEYNSIPEDIRAKNYTAIRHDFDAQARNITYQSRLKDIDPNDAGADVRIKMLDKEIPPESRVAFIETPQYKQVEKQAFDNKERVTMANNLHDQLLKMKAALDAGDKTLAANIGKTGVMKSINSLQGKDAVSSSEQSTRYQDLLSLPDILIQSGDSSILKTVMSRVAMAKQKGDSKAYNSAISEWNALATQSLEADPMRFFKTAYQLHDAAVDTATRNVESVINASSPYHARQLQADFPLRLPPETVVISSQPQASQFTQGAPTAGGQAASTRVSAGTSAPVATGSQTTAPKTAPASGGVSPDALEAIRAEMKRRGLIK